MPAAAITARVGLASVVDLVRYPIDRPGDARLGAIVADARRQLDSSGCLHLPGFIRAAALEQLTAETDGVADEAFITTRKITPYGEDGTGHDELPANHPLRWAGTWSNGFVGKDRIPADTIIRNLYDCDEFRAFVASCLDVVGLHQFDDPIRGLVINVMRDGATQDWHYDANEFVVSLLTRRPDAGGQFEYCPNLREIGDEHYDDVRAVIDGARARVRVLRLEVGDIQLFRGRYSLHRVTPAVGERHTVLFGFSETPGYIASVATTLLGYGRVAQAHIDAGADADATSIDGLTG